jgi:hypothetical protein
VGTLFGQLLCEACEDPARRSHCSSTTHASLVYIDTLRTLNVAATEELQMPWPSLLKRIRLDNTDLTAITTDAADDTDIEEPWILPCQSWSAVVDSVWQCLSVAGSGWQWLAVVGSGRQCISS